MTPAPIDLDRVDLTDPATFLDPGIDEMWRHRRRHAPVTFHPGREGRPGFWVVCRYDDVREVYRDDANFVSESGTVLTTLLAEGGDSAGGKMLAVTDGARHRAIRRRMLESFTPRALAAVLASVRARTAALVDAAVERGEVDVATDIAEHLPMGTICDLLAVPAADRPHLLRLTKAALSADDEDATALDALDARTEILLYFADLAARRRAHPGDDVVSTLATTEVDGRPLDDAELVLNCYSLVIGGDESSRMSSIGAVLAFARHDDQWQDLRAGRVTVESATEEILRWTTPAMHFGRRAVRDVRIGDATVSAGDVVTLWNSSANRDESRFAEPGRLLLGRTPNKHLSFGYGVHYCLGAFLGRAELAAVIAQLRTAVARIEVTGHPRRVHSNFLYGYSSLPVRLTPG